MIQLNNYKTLHESWKTAIRFLRENDCFIEISQVQHIAYGLYEIRIVLKACFPNSDVVKESYALPLSKLGESGLKEAGVEIAKRFKEGNYAFPSDLIS